MIKIISEDNKKYKLLKKLLTSKGRKNFKLFLAEGEKFLAFNPKEVFVNEFRNLNLENQNNVTILSEKLFNQISSHQSSQGVLCLFEMKDEKKANSDFILVLDRIRDPGNLGTIIRSAEFFGVKDIILINCVDVYNPKVVRATMGSIFTINFANYFKEKILDLKNEGYKIVCSSSHFYDSSLEDLNIKGKVLLVLGNETEGVDKFLLDNSDIKVTIPSLGSSESLNVSIAASILMYSIQIKGIYK